jgi:hypothetical protein
METDDCADSSADILSPSVLVAARTIVDREVISEETAARNTAHI